MDRQIWGFSSLALPLLKFLYSFQYSWFPGLAFLISHQKFGKFFFQEHTPNPYPYHHYSFAFCEDCNHPQSKSYREENLLGNPYLSQVNVHSPQGSISLCSHAHFHGAIALVSFQISLFSLYYLLHFAHHKLHKILL